MNLQESCEDCRTKAPEYAALPKWFPSEPAATAQIVDVRKVSRIDRRANGLTRIRFTTTDGRIGCIAYIREPLATFWKTASDDTEVKLLAEYFKCSIFQLAVDRGTVVSLRARSVGVSPYGSAERISIGPKSISEIGVLYGVWLPTTTDHEYVFLRDCKELESKALPGFVWVSDLHDCFTAAAG